MKEETIEQKISKSVRAIVAEETGGGNFRPDSGRFTYEVTADDRDMTVKLILKKRLGFSKRLLTKLKQGGGIVTRNGQVIKLFADVIEGDIISVDLPEERCNFIPQDIPIYDIYEDEDMLIINKQPWVVVHPTMGHPVGTIANGLMKRMDDRGAHFKIRFVNRLDRDTSGLMIVAKNSHCQDVMTKLMKSDRVVKRYIAIVHGIISEEKGTVDLPIGRKDPDDIKRCVMEDGYPSVTHYRVLRRFSGLKDTDGMSAAAKNSGFTMLELRLETGRTHQIRVHMSHIGHALVGDPLYGSEEPELIARQALHAAHLDFPHPVTGEVIELDAEIPVDMKELLELMNEI